MIFVLTQVFLVALSPLSSPACINPVVSDAALYCCNQADGTPCCGQTLTVDGTIPGCICLK